MKTYHVKRYDNGEIANLTEYDTECGDIREIAQQYGRAEDTLELYDGDDLIAMATWPKGSKVYKYCTGKNLSPNPAWRVWVY